MILPMHSTLGLIMNSLIICWIITFGSYKSYEKFGGLEIYGFIKMHEKTLLRY